MPIAISQAAKVGLFVIAITTSGYFVYRMVSKDNAANDSYRVTTRLKDATGLVENSRIKIAGIPVGYIESIHLDKGEAKVTLRIQRGVSLYSNATTAKRSISLLGEQSLVLTPGTEDRPKIQDNGEIINVVDVASTDRVIQDLAIIAEKVKAISTQAANTFGTEEGGNQMKEILKNLAEVSKEINETVKENRRTVSQSIANIEQVTARSVPKIDRILGNVESVTEDFKNLLEKNPRIAKTEPNSGIDRLRNTLNQLNEASKTLDSTLKHADRIVGRIDRGEGTLGRLTTDSTLINDVEGTVSDIREFTSGVSRLQPIVGLRSEYNIRSNGIKSFVELRLQPREDKYYLLELINDPRGKTSISQIDVSSTNPNQPAFYREVRTETTRDFRFSFMFARRLGPATFLFGIRESSGGVGLVLHALNDRFELRSDLFGFGENTLPRWREHLSYEFMKNMWITLGIDDLLNRERTDFFFGLQLRFSDEDLKTILPFTSVKP